MFRKKIQSSKCHKLTATSIYSTDGDKTSLSASTDRTLISDIISLSRILRSRIIWKKKSTANSNTVYALDKRLTPSNDDILVYFEKVDILTGKVLTFQENIDQFNL